MHIVIIYYQCSNLSSQVIRPLLKHNSGQTTFRFHNLFIKTSACLCVCDGNLNLYTRFNADGGDLLHNFRWAVQIDKALVDPHLEAIPGFGSLTARSLPGGNAQGLR